MLVMKKLILSLAIGHAVLVTPAYSQDAHVSAHQAAQDAAQAIVDAAADAAASQGEVAEALDYPSGPYPEYALGLVALATDYPHRAAALKQEGEVWYRLEVDPRGKPIRCNVTEPSGHALLDNATCAVVMRTKAVVPAEPVAGVTENSSYDGFLVWSLNEPEFTTSELELRFRVNEQGLIENCTVVSMTGSPPSDLERNPCPDSLGPFRDAEGKPVVRDIHFKLVTEVTEPGASAGN